VEYEDLVTIPTPEGVEVRLTLAGVGSRFVSAFVDSLIQTAMFIALALLVTGFRLLSVIDDAVAGLLIGGGLFLLVACYDILFEVLASGRTPGKRLNGLRVVRVSGQPIGFLSSATRNILRLIDFLPTAYFVGCIAILVTKKNQRIGDLVAGALVVRERRSRAAERAERARVQPDAYGAWDTTAITAEELAAVESFLERRDEIDVGARDQLARTLAERLRPKVPGVPEEFRGERFLEALAVARRSRGG
jgi:uncharacterized RDD family membrane protein YckC